MAREFDVCLRTTSYPISVGVMTAAIGLTVVGAGYWGPDLVRSAMATPSFHLHWLCDLNEARSALVLGRSASRA